MNIKQLINDCHKFAIEKGFYDFEWCNGSGKERHNTTTKEGNYKFDKNNG